MREAIITLHRKIDSTRKCICGSSMGLDKDWYCKRQRRNKEESTIRVPVQKNNPIIKVSKIEIFNGDTK